MSMFMFMSIIKVFLLNNFSRVINLLLTKVGRDRTGIISALGFFCADLIALAPYCQDPGPIFSKYGPLAWLIRYMYKIIVIQTFLGPRQVALSHGLHSYREPSL